ncbi:MAG TPA: hypothetical protein DEG92_04240, partial [Rikenellaceae bacterium]|nr:hypothetical protein [Rikenellaceae bacterium]
MSEWIGTIEEKIENGNMGTSSLSVLIEPTSACNLECSYCYKGKKLNRRMSFSAFKIVAQKIIDYCRKKNRPLLFVWHGGEPTLLGTDFYEQAFEFCAEIGKGQLF